MAAEESVQRDQPPGRLPAVYSPCKPGVPRREPGQILTGML